MDRRHFLKWSIAAGATLPVITSDTRAQDAPSKTPTATFPVVCSTWNHGTDANRAALAVLERDGGLAMDAVEAGVAVSEADPNVTSVGYGGWPNRDGVVQLDAAIQDGRTREVGAVAGIEGIKHPIRVARKVLEETPHVLIVGRDAQRFAVSKGFDVEDLLTDRARKAWENWKKRQGGVEEPKLGVPEENGVPGEDHDTIGQLAIDANGDIAAACTTSGMAWKIPGRVGDSPIIGAGLYCENGVGGAVATGVGEEVLKVCGSFLAVENMRRGMSPREACLDVVNRIRKRTPDGDRTSVSMLALSATGEVGAASINPGFQYAVARPGFADLVDVPAEAKK